MQLQRFDPASIEGMFEYDRTYEKAKTTYRVMILTARIRNVIPMQYLKML